MHVVVINGGNRGSTAKIIWGIRNIGIKSNLSFTIFSPPGSTQAKNQPNNIFTGTILERRISERINTITGNSDACNLFGTHCMLEKIKQLNPDIIHLHNLHGSYINLRLLFSYIKQHHIKVIWTLHDCWAFTGHCPHFSLAGCSKWKVQCHHCPSYREYPKSLFDNSALMYRYKKEWFCGVEDMTIVTPSAWLADLVKQSFLKEYPVMVINNGIDLGTFHPMKDSHTLKAKYHCQDKHLILGVAYSWGVRKGLDVFIELSKKLPDSYQIILVGTNKNTDELLPENIISIHKTENQTELAKLYSAADVFVNPTREDNFPTVNMEALACGTPVITFRTGGSPEIPDETCGSVVACNDITALEKEIIRVCTQTPYTKDACLARAANFNMHDKYMEYVQLYTK